ncbi:MAG TPA: hypothetical protein VK870_02880 [Ignavibacteriaceae bacterium]|nr:hypothetical protein [Ignavibacteriaceae bacterium]
MTIQKFKSFEEAERALWNYNPDEEYFKKVSAFYALFSKLNKFSYPKGIYKFKSFEEAEEHKQKMIVESAIKRVK